MNFYTKLFGRLKGNLNKFLLLMRLTLILLIAGIMQVSASTYGQNISLDQKIMTIRQIFKEIKSQTGYDVLWQPAQLDAGKKINIHFKNTSLKDVISTCINGRGLMYEMQDQSIIIKPLGNQKNRPVQDSVIYKGQVTDENNKPMSGVTVKVTGSRRSTFTNEDGNFSIYGPLKGTLEFTFVGYIGKQLTLQGISPSRQLRMKLIPGNNNLGEVNIASNGYQDIPKERSTGSFEVITKEQLQHSTDPNLINRLDGITTSMNFNNNLVSVNSAGSSVASTDPTNSPLARLTIRGKNTLNQLGSNTLNTSGQVLVVIDGVASPYSIDNVNPNDVESITILKDAAAASIWGARAANGVIVVKTKHGSYNKPVTVSFNSNFTVTEKPNLFFLPKMSTSEFIDAEIFRFNASGTNIPAPSLDLLDPLYSPVVEILGQQQRNEITSSQANSQINALRGNDVRNDYNKYLFRNATVQSYSIAIDGGTKTLAYRASVGYDKTLNNTIASDQNRLVLDYSISLKPIKNLELNGDINYSRRTTDDQANDNAVRGQIGGGYYPYTRLVDNQGEPLSIPYRYRPSFVDLLSTTYGDKIRDLHFTPLRDIDQGYSNTNFKNFNINIGANYKFNDFISANIVYNYGRGEGDVDALNRKNSFFIRNLVSYFTTPDGTQQFPDGARDLLSSTTSRNNSLRGQLNVNKSWTDKHLLNAIAGMEMSDNYISTKSDQYLGLDENTLFYNNQLDYSNTYNTLFPGIIGFPFPFAQLPYYGGSNFSVSQIRTYSLFANAAYTYNNRYTISASVRKDESNLFGIGTNNHGTPFYSLGLSWNIANENFYQLSWLPKLQFRSTFGYNGNVNPAIQSVATTNILQGNQVNGLPSERASTSNVTNNSLRPEKTAVLNFGLDFGLKNNRISGSVEYYQKRTTDLIGNNSVDPTTGFSALNFNTANLLGCGVDLTINSKNLQAGLFTWSSTVLFSYNRVKVKKLYTPNALTVGDVVGGSGVNVGYDLSRVFAFKWAGLDPNTGSPRGYLNGQPYTVDNIGSYINIVNQPLSNAVYLGSAVPVYYGSFRNNFNYGAFSVSANLLFKFDYYFKRPNTVSYYRMFTGGELQSADYSQRWQKPGDETKTNVPSLINVSDQLRDVFFQNSEINVLKGDHIRLQEINISYSLGNKKWLLKSPRIYVNARNLGVLWRANRYGLDPEVKDYPNPRTYSFGFSANF